ncbi:MAG: 4Fe-4S binding protein [Nitrospirae bacterium]|nr:4Fe-4S binding protein [Nitrospirota bacterium]MBF0534697.1 4Fe-4S binding protein [Nitrospirota bacterium]MBF0616259.1 4Fe-4S binding protein [Nitrospirota bacterium]
MSKLTTIRRIYSVFFFVLFLVLLFATDFRHLKGYETALFLELSPLTFLATLLSSFTVYKGIILSLLVIIPTVFLGRFFCSWICPMGILNQWVSHIFNKRKNIDHNKINSYRSFFAFKYYLLTFLIVLAAFGSLQTGLFDPISFLTRSFTISMLPALNHSAITMYLKQPIFSGGIIITLIFIAVMFSNRFLTRLWCRALCPLGALLGVISAFSPMRIRRDTKKCTDCRKCLKYCHGACDPHAALRQSECHLCMTCIEECPEGALHYGLKNQQSSDQMPLDVNRRRIVETALATTVLFPMMKSAVNARTLDTASVIRPPGSIPEGDFLRRCIKCGECMRVCPTNVLQPALFEAGLEGLWSPVLINKIGYCEHNCVLCGHVCPTGAIMPLTVEKKIKTKIGTAFYNRGRCLPWAMNIECIVCEEVCPTSPKAIWFQNTELTMRDGSTKILKRPFIDTKHCIGCGICQNKCPVHDSPAVYITSIGEHRSKTNQMILKAN